MAHISSFSIGGLAGRSDRVELALRPDINIFFGTNGSGKTSLLKILHSALTGSTKILAGVAVADAEVTITTWRNELLVRRLTKRKPLLSRKGTLAGLALSSDSDSPRRLSWDAGDVELTKYPHSYLPTTRLIGGKERSFHEEFDESELDRTFAEHLHATWTRYNTQMLLGVRNAQENGLTALVSEILAPASRAAVGSRDGEGLPIAAVYELVGSFLARQPGGRFKLGSISEFGQRYATDQQLRNVVHHLSILERQIQESMAPRSALEALLNRLFNTKSVTLTEEGIVVAAGDQRIPLASLSSGEKHALRLFVEALSAHRNPIIIDEPELSLHVDWQRQLVSSMRDLKPASQLLLATHSPEVMVDVEDANIFQI